MFLHKEDRRLLLDIITTVSNISGVRTDIIEKDYYVTLILRELSETSLPAVFKGGTSLSKAHHVLNRFSEDIDITFTEHLGESRRRKLKYDMMKPIAEKLGLTIRNWDQIESDRNLNHYDFCYDSVLDDGISPISKYVKVETSLMSFSFPTEIKPIDNYIYSAIGDTQRDMMREYELEPFDMRVQSLSRTVVDKAFALCDYYLLNKPERNARHLYDLYKMKDCVSFDNEMKELVREVREHRLTLGNAIAPAADPSVDIAALADELISREFYRKDYDNTTVLMISDSIPYDVVIENYKQMVNALFLKQK